MRSVSFFFLVCVCLVSALFCFFFFQHCFLKRLFLPHCIAFAPWSQNSWLCVRGSVSELSVLFCWPVCPFPLPSPRCLDYGSFTGSPEVRECLSSDSVLLFQYCVGCCGSFVSLYKLSDQFVSMYRITVFKWNCTDSGNQVENDWHLDNIE